MADSVTVNGMTLELDDELYVERGFGPFAADVYVKVAAIDDEPDGAYVTLKHDGMGPDEVDLPAEDITNEVSVPSGALTFRTRSSQMHD